MVSIFIILIVAWLLADSFLINKSDVSNSIIPINKTEKEEISSLIIPHFDFFKDKRQEFLKSISERTQPKQIILVSVNHLNLGSGNIITTDQEWDFDNVKPKIDTDLINYLAFEKVITKDSTPFAEEHGIKNVIGEIAEYFSDSKITPIIIKDSTSKEEVEKLINELNTNYPKSMIVSSVDFSHYNPNSLAKIHDEFSLDALEDLNDEKIWSAETDSPQSLYVAVKWAKKTNQKFDLFYNENSGNIQNNNDSETTSTIIGSFSKNPKNTEINTSTTFLFAGDAMFDRVVYHTFKNQGLNHIFDNLGNRVFWGSDIAMLNLEGPISEKPIDDNIQANNLNFNFPPETINVLKSLRIKQVSLANNHTLNAGESGFMNTKAVLEKSGIKFSGSQNSFSEDNVLRIDSKIPVSIITLDELVDLNAQQINQTIKNEKNNGRFTIIFPHWGTEYDTLHNAIQERRAKEWIDQGADLIIGSHPHVVQDIQIYKNRPIIYSLGNFVFDQYFSKETQEGLMVGGIITKDKLIISLFPTKQVNIKPQLLSGAEKEKKIQSIININSNAGFKKIRNDTIEIDINSNSN